VTTSGALDELLRQIKGNSSPLDRLRTLALGWRTVRALSPEERSELALRLGVDGAGDLVERLAKRSGGVAPTELLEAVHAARAAEPTKLRSLLSRVRDRDSRKQLLADGMRAVGRGLLAEDEPDLFEPLPPTPEPAAVSPGVTPAPPPPEEPEQVTPPRPEPPPEVPPATPPAPTVVGRHPPAQPSLPEPLPTTPRDFAQHRQAPSPAPGRPRPALATPAAGTPAATSAVTALDRYLGTVNLERSLAGRLRVLRRMAHGWTGFSSDQLRPVLESFPEGWSRRRALVILLSHGLPSGADEALDLLAELPGDLDRMWALSALVRSRRLTIEQREAALDLVASLTTRRRLRRLANA